MKKQVLSTVVVLLICISCYAQEDAHLQKLTDGVIQLRKAKASNNALNKTVIDWSASGCPKITLMDEIRRSDNEHQGSDTNKFKINQVVTYVYSRQNTGMVSKGDYFNSTERDVYYSAIEKTVKKNSTVTYKLTGHIGPQEFVFVSFNPKTKYTATVNGKTANILREGVQTIRTGRIATDEEIVFTITNNSSNNESFVILNHNPQK